MFYFLLANKPQSQRQQRTCRDMNIPFSTLLIFFSCLILLSLSSSSVDAYTNYTVGDKLGWYDNLQTPSINYQKWASGKTFSLGDYLMFHTDSNHSVVQTYNSTTYKHCDYDNADTDDTIQWSEAEPSATAPRPITVSVPLLKQGMSYFFSGDYDGEQCKHGQHFKINVTYGKGLPDSLKDPSTVAPSPMSPEDEDATPNPDTPVSSNFDNPKEVSSDDSDDDSDNVKRTSGSISVKINVGLLNIKLSGIVGLFGLVLICY